MTSKTTKNSLNGTSRTQQIKTKETNANNKKKKVLGIIITGVILALVISGLLLYNKYSYLYDQEKIIPGVVIENVDISNLNKNDAYNKLNNQLNQQMNNVSLIIKYKDITWEYDAASLNAAGDVSYIIDEVLKLGHQGNIIERINEASAVLDNAEEYKITFGYEQQTVEDIVESLATKVESEPVNPELLFNSRAGNITNIEDDKALLYNPLKHDTVVKLNGTKAEILTDQYGNNAIKSDIFTLQEGKNGCGVDRKATVDAIIADLNTDFIANVALVTYEIEPTRKKDELLELTSLVYHSKSGISSSSSYNRDRNVDMALRKFDGMVVMPGEEVSFNETTGERTAENGFYPAPGIASDKTLELVYGGGVCQASTIIFNAAIMAGCEILDKDSHSWPLYYAEDDYGTEARDAMVNWGLSDLVFKNTTEYPIYFDTYVYWSSETNATYGYCNVYTKLLPDGQSYNYKPTLVKTKKTPTPDIIPLNNTWEYLDKTWKLDESTGKLVYKHVTSRPYKLYEVNQQILDVEGNILHETLWYKSLYNAIKGKYYTKDSLQ